MTHALDTLTYMLHAFFSIKFVTFLIRAVLDLNSFSLSLILPPLPPSQGNLVMNFRMDSAKIKGFELSIKHDVIWHYHDKGSYMKRMS